ncbi:MAG: cell division protein FtsX [Acidimicrobiales bacterium]
MALKVDYVVRETSINMRRNITLTLAAVVTMGVSLALFGSSLVVRFGVSNLSSRWEEGVELILFLHRDITDEQRSALEDKLDTHPDITGFRYFDEGQSREEAERLFRRNGAMLERLEERPDLVPTSYRVDPVESNNTAIEALTAEFRQEAGVMRAESSVEAIKLVSRVTNGLQLVSLAVAVGLLAAALMLILNTIRMAMFSRRREIEVMKLVGATNWFIRVPFMLEGVVQGLIGASFAATAVFAFDRALNNIGTGGDTNLLTGMVASSAEVTAVIVAVMFLGIVIGAAGSGWAVSRFLRV